jgi:hypothetical protein
MLKVEVTVDVDSDVSGAHNLVVTTKQVPSKAVVKQ